MAPIGCVGVNFSFQLIYQHLYFMLQWVSGVDKNKQNLLYFYGLRRVQIINIKKYTQTVKFIDFPQCIKMFNSNFLSIYRFSILLCHFLIYFSDGKCRYKETAFMMYTINHVHIKYVIFPQNIKLKA